MESKAHGARALRQDIRRPHTTWFGDASHSGPLASPGDAATWSGVMSGVEASPSAGPGAFVHGDSAITVSGLAAGVEVSVDVAFTNIVNEDTGAGIGDMVWRGLPLQGREFGTGDVLFDDGPGIFRTRASVPRHREASMVASTAPARRNWAGRSTATASPVHSRSNAIARRSPRRRAVPLSGSSTQELRRARKPRPQHGGLQKVAVTSHPEFAPIGDMAANSPATGYGTKCAELAS